MATYISYTPNTIITSAMFNFDEFGLANYKLDGTVRVSLQDSLAYLDQFDLNYFLAFPASKRRSNTMYAGFRNFELRLSLPKRDIP